MRKYSCEIVNMIMIEDGNKCLVLEKNGSWPGYTFPGGHVEKDESFLSSVIREAKEETGYDITNVEFVGTINWCNKKTGERYIELLYKTKDYTGELRKETNEGKVFWLDKEELKKSPKLSENFEIYLNMYFGEGYKEVFLDWNGESWDSDPIYIK